MTDLSRRGVSDALTDLVRTEHARVVGWLVRRYGDVDLAEDAVAEALEAAAQRWPSDGVPASPGGWLHTTAHRKALDRVRREAGRLDREKEAAATTCLPTEPLGVVDDDRLRLLFMCCHPSLAPDMQVALTLRLVSGLTVPEIATAFLVPERTMAQRLTRAKRRLRETRPTFEVPSRGDLSGRLDGVLSVLFLLFNEGYLPASGQSMTRDDLVTEAVRQTRQLVGLMADQPEARGLLALMLLTQARGPARVVDGRLVPTDEQDRRLWDPALRDEGLAVVDQLVALGRPGRYQLLAAISAVHMDAERADDVRWSDVLHLYDLLRLLDPSPVVALNRAVALGHVEGAAVAMLAVDSLDLSGYHPWHVVRAHCLEQLGRRPDAVAALDRALELVANPLERAHLERRRQVLAG